MAICPYCGESAGFFTRYHGTCLQKAEEKRILGTQEFNSKIRIAFEKNETFPDLIRQLDEIKSRHKLTSEVAGDAVLNLMDELSRSEPAGPSRAELLFKLGERFVGTPETVDPKSPLYAKWWPAFSNVGYSQILWHIMNGQPVTFPNPCDVVLQREESRLAEFGTVLYRKTVAASSHSGGYNGISVRIASGLYYRFGRYGGQSVSMPVQNLDVGFLILTNVAMYFAGQERTFRVPYSLILRFKAYPDGLGFFRNIGDGTEEIFTIVDPRRTLGLRPSDNISSGFRFHIPDAVTMSVGWFLYNLVMFLTTPQPSASPPEMWRATPGVEPAELLGREAAALRDAFIQPLISQDLFLTKTLVERLGPQAEAQLQSARGPLTDEDLAKGTIESDFDAVMLHMIASNGPITVHECHFYRAFQEHVKPGLFAKLTDSQLRGFIETLTKSGSPFTQNYTKPLTITNLEMYDARSGTQLSVAARSFLMRLATAAASTEGPPSSKAIAELHSMEAALQVGLHE